MLHGINFKFMCHLAGSVHSHKGSIKVIKERAYTSASFSLCLFLSDVLKQNENEREVCGVDVMR